MDDTVEVEALGDHNNEYGAKREKAKGDKYRAPAAVAKSLAASGLVKAIGEKSKGGDGKDGAAD